jgi:hypothetical protein
MQVTFRRTGERRYAVEVERSGAPPLVMDPAPGYDERMPHDLAHFLVERDLGIAHGVFGQLAEGGTAGTFRRADGVVDRRLKRRSARLLLEHRADLARSERAAGRCMAAWTKGGRPSADPDVERVCASFDEVSARWQELAEGEAVTLEWVEARGPRHARDHRSPRPGRSPGPRDQGPRRSRRAGRTRGDRGSS